MKQTCCQHAQYSLHLADTLYLAVTVHGLFWSCSALEAMHDWVLRCLRLRACRCHTLAGV